LAVLFIGGMEQGRNSFIAACKTIADCELNEDIENCELRIEN